MRSSVGLMAQAPPYVRIGESDCELLGSGRLVQPVNALTSAAYVVVALVVAGAVTRRGVDRPRTFVYAACLAFVGVGSILFHGPQPAASRELHDLPILLTVAFIVAADLELLAPRVRSGLVVFAVAAVGLTIIAFVAVDLAAVLTGVLLLALAALELAIFRRKLRPVDGATQARAYVAIVGAVVVAAATWLLGRTGSPLCDPDGTFQFHGLWHIVSSLVFGLWWWLAFWLPSAPTAQGGRSSSTADRPGIDAR